MSVNDSPERNPWGQLIQRAMQDPDFRESLVADPRTVIADATGVVISGDVEIVVLEDTSSRVHVVLPDANIDLNEIEASGGFDQFTWACVCMRMDDL